VKTVFSSFALALGISLLAACGEAPAPKPEAPEPVIQGGQLHFPAGHPQLALLKTVAASSGQTLSVDLPAHLVWNEERTQRIFPAFAGRVVSIRADVGQVVKAGAPLAQLASPDFGVAQADTLKAQSDASLTRKSLTRQRELFEAGIIARKDLDQAEADAARAQAEVARADARTRLYGGSASVNQQLALSSGINGVVVERNLNPGQEIRPDQSGPGVPALFVVTDPTSLWVQIDVRESEAALLRPGATFELWIATLPGQKFTGRVVTAADFIDPGSRTIKVRGVVANPQRLLKAEMLATARFLRPVTAGLTIPAQAVTLRGTRQWVMVQVQPGVFEQRQVTLEHEGPRDVVVSGGLKAGELVVSENVLLLERQFRLTQDASTLAPASPASAAASAGAVTR